VWRVFVLEKGEEYRCFQNGFLEKERMMERVILISLCSSLLWSCASGGKNVDATNPGIPEAEERANKGEPQGKFEYTQKQWFNVYRNGENDAGRLKILKDCNWETIEILNDFNWEIYGWMGSIKSMETLGNDVSILISHEQEGFEVIYKTDGFSIREGSQPYDINLYNEGDTVTFYGKVLYQERPLRGHRLRFEDSWAESGRMQQPQFLVDFTKIIAKVPRRF